MDEAAARCSFVGREANQLRAVVVSVGVGDMVKVG